jgi:hypothetical protein
MAFSIRGRILSMNILPLSLYKQSIAQKIVSAYAFYYMVGDAVLTKKPLSCVRMGDGERVYMNAAIACPDLDAPVGSHGGWDQEWRQRMGIDGISYGELYGRIQEAGNNCSHFGPSVSGLTQQAFDLFLLFNERDFYIDNFFVNIWDLQAKVDLFKAAQSILFIHRSRGAADALQNRAKNFLGVKVRYLELSKWEQSEAVIADAISDNESRLVLFAGGPASKYISPRIAESNKVVIDIGNTTDQWLLHELTEPK